MKNQIKKGLSLIMAVLMVLSCWVWVAPTEAEAADAVVTFPISITFKITQESGFGGTAGTDGGHVKVFYYEMNDDGTLDTSTRHERIIENSLEGWTSGTYTRTANIPGFPCGFGGEIDDNHAWFNVILQITDFTVAGKSVASVSQFNNARIEWFYDGTGTKADVGGDNKKDDSSVWNSATRNWPAPSFKSTGFSGEKTIDVPEMGDATVKDTGAIDFAFKDSNYPNATWNKTFTFNLAPTVDDVQSNSAIENVFWYDTADKKVKATANVQKDHPVDKNATSGIKTFYLVATDGTNIFSQQINLNYPGYTAQWLADQSVSSTPETKVELADKTTCEASAAKFTENIYYGQTVKNRFAKYPTGNATKSGYTFYGFWSEPQPGNSTTTDGAYAFEADFKAPISTNEYNGLSDELKGQYAPAGIQYDPNMEITGDTTWYGWWLSNDINIKFYDINGKFLKEKAVKYGYTWTQVDAPTTIGAADKYVSGSYQYNTWTKNWVDIDGEVYPGTDFIATKDLILTPEYETVSFTSTYRVDFVNSFGVFGDEYSKEYTYRDQANVPADDLVRALGDGDDYHYEFIGWASNSTSVVPINGKNYHIVLEDGDFDVEGNAIHIVKDFTVREEVTYYPVFRRYLKSHDVTFIYPNSKGEWPKADADYKRVSFKYGETITAPADVPVEYATGGYGYTFLGWTKNNVDVNLNEQYCIPQDGIVFRAKYSDPVPTPYTLTFVYKNEKGEEVSEEIKVNHGSLVSTVDSNAVFIEELKEKVAETYDDGTSLLTYYGSWEYDSLKVPMSLDEILSYSPTSHMTFKAYYSNPQPFYTVTYKDGNTEKDFRIVTGTALPFWTVKSTEGEGDDTTESTETYLPTRPNTESGAYTFRGWYDAEEGGKEYIPGETAIEGNVTLYPQFDFGEFEYNYVFLNYNGDKLAEGTFHYNEKLDDLVAEAEKKAIREADETYTYIFLGWDKRVPSHCEGGEPGSTMTFIAQYKPDYIMYDVVWFNSKEDMENGEEPLNTKSYVYGERLRTPAVVTTPPVSTEAGQQYVFAGWYYLDSNNVEQPYTKQLTTTGDMQFFATYKLTPKKHTVTVKVNTTDSYTISVADGETIEENMIVTPDSGYVDANKHNSFTKWTIDAVGSDNEFVLGETTVTADMTICANFEESAHVKSNEQVTVLPTYPANGYTDFDGTVVPEDLGLGKKDIWCSCDREQTTEEVDIPALTDEVLPGATIYLGTQWNSDDGSTGGVQAHLNANSNIIITTSDKGDIVEDFNETGKGSGIESITAIVAADGTLEQAKRALSAGGGTRLYTWQLIQKSLITYYSGWANVPDMYKDYNANSASTADTFGLINGETYKAYFMVKDKAGNLNFFESAEFIYDTTLPELTLAGDHNGDKYCEKVTITAIDDNIASVTANGKVLNPNAEGKYEINETGVYNIVATDKAGNKIGVYAQVIEHQTEKVTILATCTEDGSIAETCLSCGKKFGEVTVLPKPESGHLDLETVHTAATCTSNGKDVLSCSACGYTQTREFKEDGTTPLYPKLEHKYSDWVVVKEATCKANGLKNRTCALCGNIDSLEIVSEGTEHNWYPYKVVKATCTTDGSRTRQCRLCNAIETDAAYAAANKATGHKPSDKYQITKEPGCQPEVLNEDGTVKIPAAYGEKFNICAVCELPYADNFTADGAPIGIKITELKAHTWVYNEELSQAPTADAEGYNFFECSECEETYKQPVAKIVKYTVSFYGEDGALIESVEKVAGESATTEKVPTKADSEDGKTRYTFAGWYTKTADGTYDKKQTLPVTVTKDIALYAKFTESDIKYTIQFNAATSYDLKTSEFGDEVEFKVLMGVIGEVREPGNDPVIKEDNVNTYEFKGWKPANSTNAEIIETLTVTGNATYTAVFEAVAKKYDVVFMNGLEGLGKITVDAGTDAKYPTNEDGSYKFGTPVKAADKEYHYTFTGWDKSLNNITAKTTVYAQFSSNAHTYDAGTVTQAADCLLPEITTYKCTACGYEKTEQTKGALGHALGDAVYDAETGENVRTCTRENCDYEERTQASYTIKFNNYNGLAVDILVVKANDPVAFDYGENGENTPVRAADEKNTYTFKGWKAADGTEYLKDAALPKATADVTYEAIYTAVPRTFRVTYVDSGNKVLYTVANITYGSKVPEYKGETKTSDLPVPTWNNEEHFVFDKWSVGTDAEVKADIVIKPTFKGVPHDVYEKEGVADCTTAGGVTKYCKADCGYTYNDGKIPALGHDHVEIERVEATKDSDGYIKYQCTRCNDSFTKVLPKAQPIIINVTVKDSNGKLISGAKVELFNGNSRVATAVSNSEGKATFTVYEDGDYSVIISGIPGYDGTIEGDINVSEGNNDIETGDELGAIEVASCSCSCHRTDFWGQFFRFFHKIIKLIAGRYICCSCPDAAYN